MKAAVLKEKEVLVVEDIPEPKAAPGEVVVKVAFCGICGSDLHSYVSDFAQRGTVMGHEWSGTIVEVGEGVKGWKIGDRVVAGMTGPCGQCLYCQQGLFEACDHGLSTMQNIPRRNGAYAEYIAVSISRLFRIPDEVTDEAAATIEPLAVGLHAVRDSNLRVGDNVVVLGAGPIGLFTMQCAKDAGAGSIVMTEMSKSRADLSMSLGADVVLDPSQVDINAEILKHFPVGPDIVYECAGVRSTFQQSVDLVRRLGRVMLVGACFEPVTINPLMWIRKQVAFKACYAYTKEEYPVAIELLRQGRVNGSALVTNVVPLTEIQDVFKALMRPSSQVKVLVRP